MPGLFPPVNDRLKSNLMNSTNWEKEGAMSYYILLYHHTTLFSGLILRCNRLFHRAGKYYQLKLSESQLPKIYEGRVAVDPTLSRSISDMRTSYYPKNRRIVAAE